MKVVLLYNESLSLKEFQQYYNTPFTKALSLTSFDRVPLPYKGRKNVPADEVREWNTFANNTLSGFDYILISDSSWFKKSCRTNKAESNLGIVLESLEFTSKVLYIPNGGYHQYHPEKAIQGVQRVIQTIKDYENGTYKELGSTIIHSAWYPSTEMDIANSLTTIVDKPVLYCDIEARSLNVTKAGIYTIAFSWDKHNFVSFPVDAHSEPSKIRALLKDFFENYKGKLVFHKANYDVPVLVYNLFMNQELTNTTGLLNGLDVFFRDGRLEDSLIVTYLATNSCSGNTLKLKELAQEFAGHWAVDVSDVTKVPLQDLLQYNGIDCLSTAYVYEKYYPLMVKDEQEDLYKSFMLPVLKNILRMQLTGLPIDLDKVKQLKSKLEQDHSSLVQKLHDYPIMKEAEYQIAIKTVEKLHAKWKKKRTTPEEQLVPINFNSTEQLQVLLYDVMALPVIELTDTKKPATDKKTLKKLINHTDNEDYKLIITQLMELADIDKILTAFIPAFLEATPTKYGHRLVGYYNLGGTVSGRLSSSNLNMQNLPATGSRFAKPVKECFISTDEWVFCGIDFNSLILGEQCSNVLC